MAKFKFEYGIKEPTTYDIEPGKKTRKISGSTSSRQTITIEADNEKQAKSKASKEIKNSKTYKNNMNKISSTAQESGIKPKIKFFGKGAGGSGSQQYEGVKEIFPKPNITIDRLKKSKGGLIRGIPKLTNRGF
jgi:hypothetical protein